MSIATTGSYAITAYSPDMKNATSQDITILCANVQLEGICTDSCSLGYNETNGKCKKIISSGPIVSFSFSELGENFTDAISSLETIPVSNFSGRFLVENPYAVYSRGAYFPGASALEMSFISQRMLSSVFTLSFWIKQSLVSGTLMTKIGDGEVLIRVGFEELAVVGMVLANSQYFTMKTSSMIVNEIWNHFSVSVEPERISIVVNSGTAEVLETNSTFFDCDNSTVILGADEQFTSIYQGFMYNFETYNYVPKINEMVKLGTKCDKCDICPPSGACLSNCEADQIYDSTKKACMSCPNECPTSCKSYDNCNMCADEYCLECTSYDLYSCTKCEAPYEVKNSICIPCSLGFFYNSNTLYCEVCDQVCLGCSSYSTCTSCKDHSSLSKSSTCSCDKGYSYNQICIRNTFLSQASLNSDNSVSLRFTEPLSSSLSITDLSLSISTTFIGFQITENSKKDYILTPILPEDLKKNMFIEIEIINFLTSKDNSLCSPIKYIFQLIVTEDMIVAQEVKVKAKQSKGTASSGSTAGVSVAFSTGMLNFDPTSFFDFLNTAEMYYAIYLTNSELNPILSEFLLGLRVQDLLPNVFGYVIDSKYGAKMPKKLDKLGYNTNLSILNVGVQITTLIIFLLLIPLILSLFFFPWCKKKLINTIKVFRYKIFLRFWLQTFFEFFIVAGYGIKYNKFENAGQIVDFCLCLLIYVKNIQGFQIFGLCILINAIRIRYKLRTTEEIENFYEKFGTFFEEFKDQGIRLKLFYVIYILRRLFLGLSIFFSPDPAFQVCVAISFSISVFYM